MIMSLIFIINLIFHLLIVRSELINFANETSKEIIFVSSNSEVSLNDLPKTEAIKDIVLNLQNPQAYNYSHISTMPLIIRVNHSYNGEFMNYTCYIGNPCFTYTLPNCLEPYDPLCYVDIEMFSVSGMKLSFTFERTHTISQSPEAPYYLIYYQYGYYADQSNSDTKAIGFYGTQTWQWSLCSGYQASSFFRHMAMPNSTYSFSVDASWAKTTCNMRWISTTDYGYCDSTCSQYLPRSFSCQYHLPSRGEFLDIEAPSLDICYSAFSQQKPNFTSSWPDVSCFSNDPNYLLPCLKNNIDYQENYVCYQHHCVDGCNNDDIIYYRMGSCSSNYSEGFRVDFIVDCESYYQNYDTDDAIYYCVDYYFTYPMHVVYILSLIFGVLIAICFAGLRKNTYDDDDENRHQKKISSIVPEENIAKKQSAGSTSSQSSNICLVILYSFYYLSLFCYSFHHSNHERQDKYEKTNSFIRIPKPTLTTIIFNLGQKSAALYGTYLLYLELYDSSYVRTWQWNDGPDSENLYASLFYLNAISGLVCLVSIIPMFIQYFFQDNIIILERMEIWKIFSHLLDDLIMFGFYMQANNLIAPCSVLTFQAISTKYYACLSNIFNGLLVSNNILLVATNLLNASFLLAIMFPVVKRQPSELYP